MELDIEIAAFEADIKQLTELLDIPLAQGITKVAVETFTDVVALTPVDTGRARASWTISDSGADLSTQPPGEYQGYKSNPTGIAQSETAQITQNRRVTNYFIANGLPYISRLNDGSSTQAPAGFVEIAIAQNEAKVETQLEAILGQLR